MSVELVIFHSLSHLIFRRILRDECYNYLHFKIREKKNTVKLSILFNLLS